MLPQEVIARKRDGRALPPEPLREFVLGYARGEVPDYQMAAFAMATCLRGMDFEETCVLTEAMVSSGERLDFSDLGAFPADKHSTGGVGDKVSLVLAPLVASCGVAVPMLSGRGLGLTGGTLDKLESIPGYRTDLSPEAFQGVVGKVGCSISGQSAELAPADKKLYALRDVTATVPSVPLITASILGKKLAAGVRGLVLDVKAGSGTFMKTPEDAAELAETLVAVGSRLGCRVEALVTDMDRPLGRCVGNALEVAEVIQILRHENPEEPDDLRDLTLALAARMLAMADPGSSEGDNRTRLADALSSGRAYERFLRMVEAHGGDPASVEHPERLPRAAIVEPLPAPASGHLEAVNAEQVGLATFHLGAGRKSREDPVDPAVGLSDLKQVGDTVSEGEPLALVHARSREDLEEARRRLLPAFRLSPEPREAPPRILRTFLPEELSQ